MTSCPNEYLIGELPKTPSLQFLILKGNRVFSFDINAEKWSSTSIAHLEFSLFGGYNTYVDGARMFLFGGVQKDKSTQQTPFRPSCTYEYLPSSC